MPRHKWTWKTLQGGYLLVCSDCGTADRFYKDEEQANSRIKQLNSITRLNPYEVRYGFNRKMRTAKRESRERSKKTSRQAKEIPAS